MKWLSPILLVSATFASANHELDNRDLVSGQTLYKNGFAKLMRTRIRLLAQPKSMRSIVDATQRQQRHGSA